MSTVTALQPYTLISGGGLVTDPTLNEEDLSRLGRMELTFNQLLISRRELIGRLTNRDRNIDEECGYPLPWTSNNTMGPEEWQDLHDWDWLAATINSLMATECFQVEFEVYEDEDPENITEFEEAVDAIGGTQSDEPSHYAGNTLCVIQGFLKRAWEKALIGRHGAILFGFDDVKPGDATGLRNPVEIKKYPGRRLLYLRSFTERLAKVSQWETDLNSPRYGKPLYYEITFGDPNEQKYSVVTQPGTASYNRQVHYSRVLHLCKDDGDHPYYHKPECQDVIKPITNIQKTYGADGEGRWKAGFMTISIETTNPDIVPDRAQLKTLVEDWERSLTRMWALDGGLTAKTISPSIVDPTPSIEINLRAISIRKRIPKRKLEGSERGELSSGQDDGDWNDQVKGYAYNVLNPRLIIPFFDRLINVGVLPVPGGPLPTPDLPIFARQTSVALGEPFRSKPGEMISPVLANAPYGNGTPKPNGKPGQASTAPSSPATSPAVAPPATTKPSPRKGAYKVKRKEGGYYIHWPDIAAQTDDQKAAIATQIITALGTYIEKDVDHIVPVREMLVGIFRGLFTEDEVDAWMDAAERAREEQKTLAHKQAQTEIDSQKEKVKQGVELDPVQQEKEKQKAETEAYMNKIAEGGPPIGNQDHEWDGVTCLVTNDFIVPITNKGKAQLSGGRWVTTDEGHHLYLKGGVPIAGNPHVIAKLQGKSPKSKKSSKINIADVHSSLKEMGYDLGKGAMDLKTGKTHYEVTTPGGIKQKMGTDEIKNLIKSKGIEQPPESKPVPKSIQPQPKLSSQDTSAHKSFTKKEDTQAAVDHAREHYGDWGKSLNPQQKAALTDYGGTEGYKIINGSLRGGHNLPAKQAETVKHLDDAIAAAPPTKEPMLMYRGVGAGVAGKLEVGKDFIDHGYTSTSHNRHIASGFAEDAMIEVSVPKGTRMASMDGAASKAPVPNETENEYVLPRGSRYRVTGKRKDPEFGTVITVEVVQ